MRYAGGIGAAAGCDPRPDRAHDAAKRPRHAGRRKRAGRRAHAQPAGRPPAVRQAAAARAPAAAAASRRCWQSARSRRGIVERNPQLGADAARIAGAEKTRELDLQEPLSRISALAWRRCRSGNRVASWDLMFEVNIPLQQDSRRAQEREAERMLDAARSRKAVTLNQMLAELAESLAALRAARRVEDLVGNSLLPQAELTLQSALSRLRNGQGRLRHGARCAAPDAQGQGRSRQGARQPADAPGRYRTRDRRRAMKTGMLVGVVAVLLAAQARATGSAAQKVGAGEMKSRAGVTAATAAADPPCGRRQASCSTTAIRWACPTPRRRRRRTRWAWTTSPSMRARTTVARAEVKISTAQGAEAGRARRGAALRELSRPVRAAGRVEVDERRLSRRRAEVRGLDRAACTSMPPASRWQGQAAVRGLQSGAGVGAA